MKKIFHVIIPVFLVSIILVNALFGHLIFDFASGLDINRFSTYIHFQPEWESHQKNILFEVTTVWNKPESTGDVNDPYYDPTLEIQGNTEYNPNELKFINNKPYVELKHEFSDCINSWKPLSYRHIIETLGHKMDNWAGLQVNSDPYYVIYPEIKNSNYDIIEQKKKLEQGYSQFIPICTSSENTSYDFSVKINDENIGFDVFFIPDPKERENYFENFEDFSYYQEDGCYGHNLRLFTGKCENVSKDSGLLIIIPDELKLSLTKITVYLHEKE